jgi:hypothetical protein
MLPDVHRRFIASRWRSSLRSSALQVDRRLADDLLDVLGRSLEVPPAQSA